MVETSTRQEKFPTGSPLLWPTLVLNRHWRAIDTKPVYESLCDVFTEEAQILGPDYQTFNIQDWLVLGAEDGKPSIGTMRGHIRVPTVVINHYDRIPKRITRFSRGNLWKRDAFHCQFCGIRPRDDELTVDHVIPKRLWTDEWHVLGTKMEFKMTSFGNCVLACLHCNKRKDGRTLQESGMRLQKLVMDKATGKFKKVYYETPKVPPWNPCYSIRRRKVPLDWREWLEGIVDELYWNTELEP